jgi:hypothetical protein
MGLFQGNVAQMVFMPALFSLIISMIRVRGYEKPGFSSRYEDSWASVILFRSSLLNLIRYSNVQAKQKLRPRMITESILWMNHRLSGLSPRKHRGGKDDRNRFEGKCSGGLFRQSIAEKSHRQVGPLSGSVGDACADGPLEQDGLWNPTADRTRAGLEDTLAPPGTAKENGLSRFGMEAER